MTVGDDIRRAARPDRPPAWHRYKLDRLTLRLWRICFWTVGILAAGGLADLLR